MKLDLDELAGAVALVGAGPGDPDLLTVRAATLLARADVVLYDHLAHPSLLGQCAPNARTIFVGKVPDGPRTPQRRINAMLIEHAQAGRFVVRLKGGDPFVFGRGGEEALALAGEGIACEVVPGISSCVAVPAAAGIPVTHRGVTTHFSVITGFGAADTGPLADSWRQLAAAGGTLVILMGVRRLHEIVAALIDGGRDPNTPAALIHAGTTDAQQTVEAPLQEIAQAAEDAGITSPATFIVGDVVALRAQLALDQPSHAAPAQPLRAVI